MSEYFFYCPNCLSEEVINKLPKLTIPNLRDGFGRPVYHCECEKCHNLDAGCMQLRYDDEKRYALRYGNEKNYIKSVIEVYQGVCGFGNKGQTDET